MPGRLYHLKEKRYVSARYRKSGDEDIGEKSQHIGVECVDSFHQCLHRRFLGAFFKNMFSPLNGKGGTGIAGHRLCNFSLCAEFYCLTLLLKIIIVIFSCGKSIVKTPGFSVATTASRELVLPTLQPRQRAQTGGSGQIVQKVSPSLAGHARIRDGVSPSVFFWVPEENWGQSLPLS